MPKAATRAHSIHLDQELLPPRHLLLGGVGECGKCHPFGHRRVPLSFDPNLPDHAAKPRFFRCSSTSLPSASWHFPAGHEGFYLRRRQLPRAIPVASKVDHRRHSCPSVVSKYTNEPIECAKSTSAVCASSVFDSRYLWPSGRQ